jgi:hypothetical protein
MAALLIHDPWVRLYLLYAAVLSVVHIWAFVRNPQTIQDDSRTPRKEVAHGLFLSAASQTPPRSVSRPGRRIEKEVQPIGGDRRFQAPR